jgi:hypothetical protein
MIRLLSVFLGFLLMAVNGTVALAASPKATALRQANGLTAFTPTEKFLAGNFVADEMNPAFIFGTVKSFAASRKCPTSWLIEDRTQNRQGGRANPIHSQSTPSTWRRTARTRWSIMSSSTRAA